MLPLRATHHLAQLLGAGASWPAWTDWHSWTGRQGLHHLWNMLSSSEWVLTPLAGAAILSGRKLLQRAREDRAAGWPVTDATITQTRVHTSQGFWVVVEYRFFARGEYRYGKFRRHFRRKQQAQTFSAAVAGLQVPVHYQTEHPEISVLIERDLHLAWQMTGALETNETARYLSLKIRK